jgi:8-hydroxy-5-deazaflavin:NADPH oxidoreductase
MRVAVIGAGRIGGTIGGKWEAAGHEVVYGLRDPAKKAGATSISEALKSAGIVLLAIPGAAVVEFVQEHAKDLEGKVVIDATNNFRGKSMNSWPEVTAAAPKAKLYRAFNSYGWEMFAKPELGGEVLDLFYAGPEGESQKTVEQLISDVGARPIWVGADAAETVDGVLRLWYTLAQHRGRRIGFRLIAD